MFIIKGGGGVGNKQSQGEKTLLSYHPKVMLLTFYFRSSNEYMRKVIEAGHHCKLDNTGQYQTLDLYLPIHASLHSD